VGVRVGIHGRGVQSKGFSILALASLLFTCFSISVADTKAADGALPTDAFGQSVAVSGSTIVISDENHNGKGYAYVFTRDGASWRPAAEESGLSGFAWNVVTSGSNFAVGTLYGRAYVYTAGVQGWQRTADLKSPYKGDKSYFGDPIAFSATTLLVAGQPNDEPSSATQIFVFTDGSTGWAKTGELSKADTAPGETSTATSGVSVVISSESHNGRAYVFTDGPKGWAQTAELGGPDARRSYDFGAAVAISGGTIVVGDPDEGKGKGRAYVFTKTAEGWHQSAELQTLNAAGSDQFGSAVAVSGSTIVVGDDDSDGQRGTAYVFAETANSWKQVAELNPSGTIASSGFGTAVAISGTTIVVGTEGNSGCGELSINGGASQPVDCDPPGSYGAYVYSETAGGWHEVTDLHRPNK
jgi:hypothetical protein